MARIVEVPIVYRNEGVAPRARTPGTYYVKDTALVSVPEAESHELESALTYRNRYIDKAGVEHTYEMPFKQINGHLVRPASASIGLSDSRELTVELLTGLAQQGHSNLPEQLMTPMISPRYYSPSGLTFDVSQLKDKHITTSGKDEAILALQTKINDTMMIVDGIVYAHTHDPRLVVAVSETGFTTESILRAQGPFSFPCDRPDLAIAFTDWLSKEQGLTEETVESYRCGGEFIIDSTSVPLSANPVIDAVSWVAEYADLNTINAEPFGAEVKRLGLAFSDDKTVEKAMAFFDAFEDVATQTETMFYFDKVKKFAAVRKFIELMPAEYKEEYEETINVTIGASFNR